MVDTAKLAKVMNGILGKSKTHTFIHGNPNTLKTLPSMKTTVVKPSPLEHQRVILGDIHAPIDPLWSPTYMREKVTVSSDSQRRKGKTAAFGLLYGMSGLGGQLHSVSNDYIIMDSIAGIFDIETSNLSLRNISPKLDWASRRKIDQEKELAKSPTERQLLGEWKSLEPKYVLPIAAVHICDRNSLYERNKLFQDMLFKHNDEIEVYRNIDDNYLTLELLPNIKNQALLAWVIDRIISRNLKKDKLSHIEKNLTNAVLPKISNMDYLRYLFSKVKAVPKVRNPFDPEPVFSLVTARTILADKIEQRIKLLAEHPSIRFVLDD